MSAPEPGGELSEADRDHVIALLREHFAIDHFDVDEFSRRVETVLSAPTADAATAAVADLPPLEQPAGTNKPRRSRWRRLVGGRHAQTNAALAGWLSTSERFRDPSSGKLMRVWTDPADASRHYVPEQAYSPDTPR